jgi:hypothetical protein
VGVEGKGKSVAKEKDKKDNKKEIITIAKI